MCVREGFFIYTQNRGSGGSTICSLDSNLHFTFPIMIGSFALAPIHFPRLRARPARAPRPPPRHTGAEGSEGPQKKWAYGEIERGGADWPVSIVSVNSFLKTVSEVIWHFWTHLCFEWECPKN